MKLEEIEKNRYKGLKIGLIGFAVSFIGFYVGYYTYIPIAHISILIGFVVVAIGMYIHYKNWFKEMKADPKELYKAPKQPWEKDE